MYFNTKFSVIQKLYQNLSILLFEFFSYVMMNIVCSLHAVVIIDEVMVSYSTLSDRVPHSSCKLITFCLHGLPL